MTLPPLPPRCPNCGAPARKLGVEAVSASLRPPPDVWEYTPPTDCSDAMIDAVMERLDGWGLLKNENAREATRQAINRALQILAKEIEYRWL